jgi:MYXO-CTERM domain-containing protein
MSRLTHNALAGAVLLLTTLLGRAALPCSPASGWAAAVWPDGSAPVAEGTNPALLWLGAFTLCTAPPCELSDGAALYEGDLGGGEAPTTPALAVTREDLPAGLFATLVRLSPTDGPLDDGTYTLVIEYSERSPSEDSRHVFTVDGARPAPVVAAPHEVVWDDERFTATAVGDSCTGAFDRRLFLRIEVEGDLTAEEVVWYEITLESTTGDDEVQALVPRHLFEEVPFATSLNAGALYPPTDFELDCIAVRAVHLEGARSEPFRLCQPTRCVVRDPVEAWDPVDWDALPACETGGPADPDPTGDEPGDFDPSDTGVAPDAGGDIPLDLEPGAETDTDAATDAADAEAEAEAEAEEPGPGADLSAPDVRSDAAGADPETSLSGGSGCCAIAAGGDGSAHPGLAALLALVVLAVRRRCPRS